MTTRSAPSTSSSRSSCSATRSKPSSSVAPRRGQAAGEPASRTGALEVRDVDAVLVEVHLHEALEATFEQLDLRRATHPSAGRRPGPRRRSRVRTSHATTSSTPRRRCSGISARSAPSPPSVVAEPPTPTTMRFAPASSAAAIELAGAVGRGGDRVVALGAADQMPVPTPGPSRSRRCARTAARRASTGSPSGPVTVEVRFAPPSTSSSALATVGEGHCDRLVTHRLDRGGHRPPRPRAPRRCPGTCRARRRSSRPRAYGGLVRRLRRAPGVFDAGRSPLGWSPMSVAGPQRSHRPTRRDRVEPWAAVAHRGRRRRARRPTRRRRPGVGPRLRSSRRADATLDRRRALRRRPARRLRWRDFVGRPAEGLCGRTCSPSTPTTCGRAYDVVSKRDAVVPPPRPVRPDPRPGLRRRLVARRGTPTAGSTSAFAERSSSTAAEAPPCWCRTTT